MPINYVVRKKKIRAVMKLKSSTMPCPVPFRTKESVKTISGGPARQQFTLGRRRTVCTRTTPESHRTTYERRKNRHYPRIGNFLPGLKQRWLRNSRRMYAQQSQIDTHLLPGRYCVHLRRETLRIRKHATAIYKEAEAR